MPVSELVLIRHGESMGNAAAAAANAANAEVIVIDLRDADVPLSPVGVQQAEALSIGLAPLTSDGRPYLLWSSPYVRAVQTAEVSLARLGINERIAVDERLRDRELGVLDLLTTRGVAARYPVEAQRRLWLGKFYHRPPGGESWCDVILRLRSLLDTISLHYSGRRVLIVAHQVVVLCLRYVIEGLSEEEILAIDREGDVVNCSVTEYRFDPDTGKDGSLKLAAYNVTAPLVEDETPVTDEPDAIVAARG